MDIAKTLSPIEREVLPHIKDNSTLKDLIKHTGKKEVEVMRAIQWLQNKNIINIKVDLKEIVSLGELGKQYLNTKLPERRLLDELKNKGEIKLNQVSLPKSELNIAIGELKRKAAINLKENIVLTDNGRKFLTKEFIEEKFLSSLPKELKEIANEEKLAYNNLRGRKDLIKTELEKTRTITLTELGKKLTKQNLKFDLIESLTPDIIKSKSWKGKEFRSYDVKINVPAIYGGKKHFVNQAIEHGKRIWLDMGFKEMTGTKAVSSFWNFDALFTAQDHPVREIHDTFFVKGMQASLPKKELVEKVRQAHEKGIGCSKGWQYLWNEKTAQRVLIRTHTTCLSAQTLANLKKEDMPAKFFAIGKCFRNETVDWKHGFEFNQTEGIVIDPNANFRHLLGYLKEFANKMGFKKVRFQPSYFPYTEPSVEGLVYNEERKEWIEAFAAGIFRPEVTIPLLGEAVPVLAWGPGFDRLIMMAYDISDLREFYSNDLKKIKEKKLWQQ